jgi:hypothetical protein
MPGLDDDGMSFLLAVETIMLILTREKEIRIAWNLICLYRTFLENACFCTKVTLALFSRKIV